MARPQRPQRPQGKHRRHRGHRCASPLGPGTVYLWKGLVHTGLAAVVILTVQFLAESRAALGW